jgi:hypothetical protein
MQIRWPDEPPFDKSGAMPMTDRLLTPGHFLWATRIVWVAVAITMGLAISGADEGRGSAARVAGPVAWWVAVAAVTVALVVPSTAGLTVVRMVVTSSVPSAALALGFGASTAEGTAALALGLLCTLLALSGETGEAMVQGAAYGDERRFPLRLPAAVLPPAALSWLVWCAAVLGAVVLLAARQLVPGAIVGVVAVALTWLLGVRFHRLACRWLVILPAGVVVRDPMVLGETLMVQRPNVAIARLALADTQAADLTGPAAGHALDITVKETVLAVFPAGREHPQGRAVHMHSFLVAPTRPGRALQAMAAMKVPVG